MRVTLGAALVLAVLASAPAASAGLTMGGAHYSSGNLDLVFAAGVASGVQFTAGGVIVLDGVTFDLRANVPTTWTLTEWSSSRVVIVGTPAGTGSLHVDGLQGVWRISGATGYPALNFQGTGGPTFNLASGAQTITLEKQTSATMIQDVESAIGDGFAGLLTLLFAAIVILAVGGLARLRASPSKEVAP